MKSETTKVSASRKEKFNLGRVTATPAVMGVVGANEILLALARHAAGDWGSVGWEDKEANERALRDSGRLLSSYYSRGTKFWIITEPNRSATTVLLPEDY